jgi:hypothetical protein
MIFECDKKNRTSLRIHDEEEQPYDYANEILVARLEIRSTSRLRQLTERTEE